MKTYEATSQSSLLCRTPVIIRIDGKAFHTFAKRITQNDPTYGTTPFSEVMHDCMTITTHHLVKSIQGCVLGYTQSDEISLLIRDWDELTTQQWFGNNVQKLTSVSASLATQAFNFYLTQRTGIMDSPTISDFATFDSRAFNIPNAEVANYFIWRQQDAIRNSMQMLGHHAFSQKQMHGKPNTEVRSMLDATGFDFNLVPMWAQRGSCIENAKHGIPIAINNHIPVFTEQREYIDKFMQTPSSIAEQLQRDHQST